MNSRHLRDVIVVGGGVVGATCAVALAQLGLKVALIESVMPKPWSIVDRDLRVYAFASDNVAFFDRLGVWDAVHTARVQSYRRMQVWSVNADNALVIDADEFGRCALGWIVEHRLLVRTLWSAFADADISVYCPNRVVAFTQEDDAIHLQLDTGEWLDAHIAVAADGADSDLRKLAGITIKSVDYMQRGIVAYVKTAQPHCETAWQRFLTTGPVAFLPCSNGIGSIVWTLPEDEAIRILALDDVAFNHALTGAFDGCLGTMSVTSPRVSFRLRRQLADRYISGRMLLLGDAAHVVHPLAGQGVNLGLRDVSELHAMVVSARRCNNDWRVLSRLLRWAQQRKSENAVVAYTLDYINRLYSNDDMVMTLLREPLLGIVGKSPSIMHLLWRRASGF